MKIGAMTNPRLEPLAQIRWIGANGFDYVDLAVEPPAADVAQLDAAAIKGQVRAAGLDLIVHTSPFLPLANPHGSIREAALNELLAALSLAADLESPLLTLHFLGAPNFWRTEQVVATYADILNALAQAAAPGIRIAIENSPVNANEAPLLAAILERAPTAGLLLDIGHAHIGGKHRHAADWFAHPLLARRLCHVHLSDNDGRGDLHLPPGSCRAGVDWPAVVGRLKGLPYDGTFTLEVFSPDLDFLVTSRQRFARLWEAAA